MTEMAKRALARVKLTAGRSRSGAQKRRDRGRRGKVQVCERIVGTDRQSGDPLVCGSPLVVRHGHARCPVHGVR